MHNTASFSDKKVIISIKEGEIENFSYIVRKYAKPISYFIDKKIFNKHDVDDVVQNTFINFYKAIGRFDEKRPVLPYLYEIAQNELKMYYRSRRQTLPLDENIVANETDDIKHYRRYEINKLLKQLPAQQQKALNLLADGYSYQEIARTLKKPLNTIRTIIRRGRLKINQLADYEKS